MPTKITYLDDENIPPIVSQKEGRASSKEEKTTKPGSLHEIKLSLDLMRKFLDKYLESEEGETKNDAITLQLYIKKIDPEKCDEKNIFDIPAPPPVKSQNSEIKKFHDDLCKTINYLIEICLENNENTTSTKVDDDIEYSFKEEGISNPKCTMRFYLNRKLTLYTLSDFGAKNNYALLAAAKVLKDRFNAIPLENQKNDTELEKNLREVNTAFKRCRPFLQKYCDQTLITRDTTAIHYFMKLIQRKIDGSKIRERIKESKISLQEKKLAILYDRLLTKSLQYKIRLAVYGDDIAKKKEKDSWALMNYIQALQKNPTKIDYPLPKITHTLNSTLRNACGQIKNIRDHLQKAEREERKNTLKNLPKGTDKRDRILAKLRVREMEYVIRCANGKEHNYFGFFQNTSNPNKLASSKLGATRAMIEKIERTMKPEVKNESPENIVVRALDSSNSPTTAVRLPSASETPSENTSATISNELRAQVAVTGEEVKPHEPENNKKSPSRSPLIQAGLFGAAQQGSLSKLRKEMEDWETEYNQPKMG